MSLLGAATMLLHVGVGFIRGFVILEWRLWIAGLCAIRPGSSSHPLSHQWLCQLFPDSQPLCELVAAAPLAPLPPVAASVR